MPVGAFPNGVNTLVPLLEASGHLQIRYSRNPKSMRLNQYTSQKVASSPRGAYLEFNPNDGIRKRSRSKWAYGTPARTGFDNLLGFEQKNFFCERYSFDATLDLAGVNFANFDVQKPHAEKLAMQAMINRTEVSLTAITNTANYRPARRRHHGGPSPVQGADLRRPEDSRGHRRARGASRGAVLRPHERQDGPPPRRVA
jgi:hypothetical protein